MHDKYYKPMANDSKANPLKTANSKKQSGRGLKEPLNPPAAHNNSKSKNGSKDPTPKGKDSQVKDPAILVQKVDSSERKSDQEDFHAGFEFKKSSSEGSKKHSHSFDLGPG